MPCVAAAQQAASKVNHFGIEVSQGLMWQGWEPGREYTKHITLKNVKVKTQKLKYSVPNTRFFTTLYPQPVVLSAGTSFTLPVTFRPLEKNQYEDKIEFHTHDGIFEIPVKAVLPEFKIEIPSDINMKMCAAEDFVETTFEVKNASELQTPFQWEVNEPFSIQPSEGVLEPWSSFNLKVTFKPKAAKVYEAEAICKYGLDYRQSSVTKFEGIGKYPHLLVSCSGKKSKDLSAEDTEAVLNFGKVVIGKTVEKWVDIHNLSPVNAPFKVDLTPGPNRIDTVFNCPQKHGIVPAMSSIRIPFIFSPNMVGATSTDYFNVIAIGNLSKTTIKCHGSSKGPSVRLAHTMLNFSQIDTGRRGTKSLEIINDSDTEAIIQFQIDSEESIFKFDQTSGVLKPNSSTTIIVQFEPVHAISYYRRVACVVHNQGPLFVDLLGTCHSELGKPAVLQAKHIERYRVHVDRGLSMFPPEHLNELLHDGKLELDDSGALMNAEAEEIEAFCDPIAPLPPMDEYFNDGYHSDITHAVPHVSTDIHHADFGNQQNLRLIEQQTINVTNHTKGKVTLVWMGDPDHVFSVLPATMDLPPLKTSSFRITFKPGAPNKFYGSELECYAFYKSMRDYRLVEDTSHFPPWCVTVKCSGQTFLPNNETFLPRYSLDSPKLIFPAVNVNESAYRTMVLMDTGTTPIFYDFEKDAGGIFSVKPTKGLLKSGCQIFTIKSVPNAVKIFRNLMKLKLNDDEKNTQEIVLYGSAESAEIMLENEGVMFFKPTCVGTATQRQYTVKNTSRIPLKFQWHMKHAEQQVLSVEPLTGVIQPNESQAHTWTFKPTDQNKVVMKPNLVVWGQGHNVNSSGGKKRSFPLRVVGEGSFGEIHAEESFIDFGNVVVGSSVSKMFTIYNNSPCNLYYRLQLDQVIDGPYPEEQVRDDPIALELEETQGMLPARSKATIHATVRPMRRVFYQFAISYQLLSPEGKRTAAEPQHLCHILTTGVFPTMAITDARCHGSASGISKKQLWGLFSLDSFNVCLDADPSSAELMYSVQTRHSHKRRPPVYTRAILDFNFSAAPMESEPCVVHLMFENTGAVPVEWNFMFPSDLQLELEYWAETGEYDDDELHEMKVMDNNLFDVSPKRGSMQPGECKTVTFTYRHIMPGTDRLPVLLKLNRGREILINFIGVTVEPERQYIHFSNNKHMFSPVPIGEQNNPKQIYELYNGGAQALKYEIDTTPLEYMTYENFDHPIFECLNPVGEILPGRTAAVEWKFSPLEAKTYMVDVPIKIHNGETALITFTGIGFDKRVMGDAIPVTEQHDLSGVPGVQSVPVPGQQAFLSLERIAFGNMPLFCRSRQIVFVINRSMTNTVSFSWHTTSKKDTQYIQISPISGVLKPGESRFCKVTFTAWDVASFYDLDLICEVTDETEMSNYRKRLNDWENEKERQKYEFTITEKDPHADEYYPQYHPEEVSSNGTASRSASTVHSRETSASGGSRDIRTAETTGKASDQLVMVWDQERPPSGRLQALEFIQAVKRDGDMPRYKTLPPIKNLSVDATKHLATFQKFIEDDLWEKPEPPRPFLLHLGVTARTHQVTDFQTNFPEEYHRYYVDRCMSARLSKAIEKKEEDQANQEKDVVTCLELEGDVVSGTLSNVIRALLDDTNFHEALQKIPEEPIPFFQQIKQDPIPDSRPPSERAISAVSHSTTRSPPMTPTSPAGSKRGSRASVRSGRSQKSAASATKTTTPKKTPTPVSATPDHVTPAGEPIEPSSAEGVRAEERIPTPFQEEEEPELERLRESTEKPSLPYLEVVDEEGVVDEDCLETDPKSPEGSTKSSLKGGTPVSEKGTQETVIMPSTVIKPPSEAKVKQRSRSEIKKSYAEHKKQQEKESIRGLGEFGNDLESIVENSLINILSEAFNEEFTITARPRIIALPPKPTSASSLRSFKSQK
ncbi:cilia- and flagella-associated protein 65-like isoform X2 [Lineus longissimus]|uniref:cilia- and flagella-associated protein 65-like isoform X2 n=1 Tax=Lineus longissimus TaxID=88925 RepID=UPI002B4F164F